MMRKVIKDHIPPSNGLGTLGRIVRTEPTCECGHPEFDHTAFSKPWEMITVGDPDAKFYGDPIFGMCRNGSKLVGSTHTIRFTTCPCRKFVATSSPLARFWKKIVGICVQVF